MKMKTNLCWLDPNQPFPALSESWGAESNAPGLLCAGGTLDTDTLLDAYSSGIYPWFSEGQPPLWWSPDPRMTLHVSEFRLHRSLKKTITKNRVRGDVEIRFDCSFDQVITACAKTARNGQPGTWILPDMVEAYCNLNRAGYAHSVETWLSGKLVGGLYCVAIGKAVFGESMFSHCPDASKIALAALVCFCRQHNIRFIDCQQNTKHLASLGAKEISREKFLKLVKAGIDSPPVAWNFDPLYWNHILPP
jgi:leucyl/phenylalanyl-tRNA--protein transferase